MKFKTWQVLKFWNSVVKPEHKIDTASGYLALQEEIRKFNAETGSREYEVPKYYTKSGNPELVSF